MKAFGYSYHEAWRFRTSEERWLRHQIVGSSLNVCSGMSLIGDVRLDLEQIADIKGDMENLPIRPGSFDTVIFDPPFNWLYDVKKSFRVIRYLCRIARKRVIVFGITFLLPYIRNYAPRLFWKRSGKMHLRYTLMLDRIQEELVFAEIHNQPSRNP